MAKIIPISIYFCVIILLLALVYSTNGHGRFIEPPSRASAWRYGYPTTPDYNDMESFCGGFTRQWKTNKGKCGECGDAFDLKKPRPHEYGGKYGQGIITGKYKSGNEIKLRVQLTAYHMGYFEFRICDNVHAEQPCLDKHLLELTGGTPSKPKPTDLKTRFYPRNGSCVYEIRGRLPANFKCKHCVLQWRYVAGNNWGTCPDGTQAKGCGPQEEFRACSDISVGEVGTSTDTNDKKENQLSAENPGIYYLGIFMIMFTLFLVLYGLFTFYLFPYYGECFKQHWSWNHKKNNSVQVKTGQSEQLINIKSSISLATTGPC